jgi:hypothetical protein
MLIFFDTEFTDLGIDPRLISIGCVSEDGREFYAELDDTYEIKDCSEFVKLAVLPQLAGNIRMSMFNLALQLGDWIEHFEQPITLATDSLNWDWPWVSEIFHEPGTWPENLDRRPDVLVQHPAFNLALERAHTAGLRRHHALDDAKANRLAWLSLQPPEVLRGSVLRYDDPTAPIAEDDWKA